MKKQHQHFIPRGYLRKFAHTQNDNTFLVDAFNKLNGQYTNEELSEVAKISSLFIEFQKHLYEEKVA